MVLVAEYYNKELLVESIRFNTHFLDLCIHCKQERNDISEQAQELYKLLKIWFTRDYPINSDVEYATRILNDIKAG